MRPAQRLLGACVVGLAVSGCASAGSPPAEAIPSGYPPAKASALVAEDRARLRNAGKPIVPASFPPIQGTLIRGIYDPGQDPQLPDEFSITDAWAGPGARCVGVSGRWQHSSCHRRRPY